jgi:hypothetical protein
MENNRFKYRPEVKSIEDLQPGDEFLVGDERWRFSKQVRDPDDVSITGMFFHNHYVTQDLIRANVPIERDIPYPEGGAEKWELREGDGKTPKPTGAMIWTGEEWLIAGGTLTWELALGYIYAIPKAKPQDKAKPAPKEYTVRRVPATEDLRYVLLGIEPADSDGKPLKPGDRVTVQRVEK